MKLLFLGDFLYDYSDINEDIKAISKYIKNNKLTTILNLEGPLKSEKPAKKMINLYSTSKMIDVLKLLNVKAVNLANNHIMDWGDRGLSRTIEVLNENKIGCFGAGLNDTLAKASYRFKDSKGKMIELLGQGWKVEECINSSDRKPGTARLDFDFVMEHAKRTKADIVIPIFHFGYEYEKLPQPFHLKKCREISNLKNVPLIIGHHPHVVQAYESKRNIFYSLGNFYFGKMRDSYISKNSDALFGIGVIYDTSTNHIDVISISYDGKNSSVKEENSKKVLNDIESIQTELYNSYFIRNGNTINKQYIYKIGFLSENIINETIFIRRNIRKFYLRNIKWPLGKVFYKLIGRIK